MELEEACEIMGRTPDWLPGIELRADGFAAGFYRK
jgi:DNA polymerase